MLQVITNASKMHLESKDETNLQTLEFVVVIKTTYLFRDEAQKMQVTVFLRQIVEHGAYHQCMDSKPW